MFNVSAGQAADDLNATSPRAPHARASDAWTVVVPFFNEHDYLPVTLSSLATQHLRPRVILVDNGSTDGSGELAKDLCCQLGLDHVFVTERRPGKVFALKAGLALVRTPFVATCDADTWYPAYYLEEAQRLLSRDDTVAAGSFYAPSKSTHRQRLPTALHVNIMGRLLSWQCHAGGAGQAFRTESLRKAGGFDPSTWNWVLEDHEIMHRVAKTGSVRYGMNFWCAPADRERDRDSIRWNLVERLCYHFCPPRWQSNFFYKFLGPRLGARKLSSERIRERRYHTIGAVSDAASDLVCG